MNCSRSRLGKGTTGVLVRWLVWLDNTEACLRPSQVNTSDKHAQHKYTQTHKHTLVYTYGREGVEKLS